MSTRSILVVIGKSNYGDSEVVRMYKHSDGYPTGTLGMIQAALAKSIKQQRDSAERFKESKPGPINIGQVVGHLIGESTTVYGQGVRVEETFDGEFKAKHLGTQQDLEWIYLVNLETETVGIFGGGYHGQPPTAALKLGPVDPEQYAERLRDECQAAEIEETKRLVESIQALGFSVNAKQPKAREILRGKLKKIQGGKS